MTTATQPERGPGRWRTWLRQRRPTRMQPGWPPAVTANARWSEPPHLADVDFAGSGPPSFTRSDGLLRDDVMDVLQRCGLDALAEVRVTVRDRLVILYGRVPEEASAERMKQWAAGVHGVQGVVAHLRTRIIEEH